MMTTIHVNESTIRDFADRLKGKCIAKHAKHGQRLQAITQALFGVTYEEAKKRGLISPNSTVSPVTKKEMTISSVWILHYGHETILVSNGNYVTGSFDGTDLVTPRSAMLNMAIELSRQLHCEWRETTLPKVLGDEYEVDDIIQLATKLHLFDHEFPLWYAVHQPAQWDFDGLRCESTISDDVDERVEDAIQCTGELSGAWGAILWFVECPTTRGMVEDYLTLHDIANAIPVEKDVWKYARKTLNGNEYISIRAMFF